MIGSLKDFKISSPTTVLYLEIYFLLRAGKSPFFFTVTDFFEKYTIEVLYLSALIVILSGWLIFAIVSVYLIVFSSIRKIAIFISDKFKIDGFPIFAAMRSYRENNSVSVDVASDFSRRNRDHDLAQRLEKFMAEQKNRTEGEAIATANFVAIIIIYYLTFKNGTPNFIQGLTNFLGAYSNFTYSLVFVLVAVQGILGRIQGITAFTTLGKLPPDFFVDEHEKEKVAAWSEQVLRRNQAIIEPYFKK